MLMDQRWSGCIAMVNTWTDDDRRIDEIAWRDFPLTLRVQRMDPGYGHGNAEPSGSIDRIWLEGDAVMGEGPWSEGDAGRAHMGWVQEGTMQGVSIDPGRIEAYDIIIAGDGTEVPIEEWWAWPSGQEPWPEPFRYATIFTLYQIAALTGVANPAFSQARIEIVAEPPATAPAEESATPGTAAGIAPSAASMILGTKRFATKTDGLARKAVPTAAPPADVARLIASSAWRAPSEAFAKRALPGFTPFEIDPDTGWYHGHIYAWNGEHRGSGATPLHPPKSTDFTQFLTGGKIPLDDGTRITPAVLTSIGGHKNSGAEYDRLVEDPANQLGPCLVYADEFGVQVCGVAWPDRDPVFMAQACASYPSGDWRGPKDRERLHGCALVTNPGFHSLDQAGQEPIPLRGDPPLRMVASFARVKGGAFVKGDTLPTARRPRALSTDGLARLRTLKDTIGRPR